MCTQKMRALSYIGAEKITLPPKSDIHTDIQTDRHTYRHTDISVYRVTSLLKKIIMKVYLHKQCPGPFSLHSAEYSGSRQNSCDRIESCLKIEIF